MNIFRLVLCLAGLAVYLVAKQFVSTTVGRDTMRPLGPGSPPEVQQNDPRLRPQTNPHEFLKADRSYVDVRQ